MTIIAKFPGTCPSCGQYITPGEPVEWSKGQKARHADCSAIKAAAPKPAARARSFRERHENDECCYQGHTSPVRGCIDCHDTFDY